MTLSVDLRLSDYIERRQKDLVFQKIAEQCEKMSDNPKEMPSDPNNINARNTMQQYENKGTVTPPARECKVDTKDVVIIKEGHASKFDTNKPRMDLLPARPLKEIAEILTYGADKYGPDNWREGEPIAFSRHYAGVQRHLFAWQSGETVDPETGKNHLAHAMCGLLFLLELSHSHPEKDDRCKSAVRWSE